MKQWYLGLRPRKILRSDVIIHWSFLIAPQKVDHKNHQKKRRFVYAYLVFSNGNMNVVTMDNHNRIDHIIFFLFYYLVFTYFTAGRELLSNERVQLYNGSYNH